MTISKSNTKPRKRPKQDRSRETVKAILQASAHILERDGISKFTTNRIAEKAGVCISSLYQYFPNKQAVLNSLLQDYFSRQDRQILEYLEKAKSNNYEPLKGLEGLLDVMCDYNERLPQASRVMLMEAKKLGIESEVERLDAIFIEKLEKHLRFYSDKLRHKDYFTLAFFIMYALQGINHAFLSGKGQGKITQRKMKKELAILCYRYLFVE